MLRYAIYTRKSDDDRSVTEKSITEQVAECTRLVERDSLGVVAKWEESRSARHPHRRALYTEMISMVERGKIDGIVCWHINRLVRNMEEGGKLAQLLIDGTLKEIRTPSAVYRTGDNIMPLVIEAASATQFSIDHSKTVTRGMVGSFRDGGCINAAPQGYRNARDALNLKKGVVERDPKRFTTVRRGWDLMLTGTHTIRQVVNTMNSSWGFRTRPTKKRGNTPLSYSGAYQMFTNPFYAGFVRRKGELIKGKHEAMITPDEFERVQQILKRRSFTAPRHKEYAFTGLMHCVYCGQQITGETKRLSTGELWENYHCADSRLRCMKLGMSRAKVLGRIARELDRLDVDQRFLIIAVENIRRALGSAQGDTNTLLRSQEKALEQATERLQRLGEMWLDGLITDRRRYEEMEERELTRKNKITTEIERIRSEAERMRKNLERSAAFLAKAKDEMKVADDRRIKEICRALAVDYCFDGRSKDIKVKVFPLLTEMVSYARKCGSLELMISGSGSKKEPTFEKSVLFGGPESKQIEPSATLLAALAGETFPELWPAHHEAIYLLLPLTDSL